MKNIRLFNILFEQVNKNFVDENFPTKEEFLEALQDLMSNVISFEILNPSVTPNHLSGKVEYRNYKGTFGLSTVDHSLSEKQYSLLLRIDLTGNGRIVDIILPSITIKSGERLVGDPRLETLAGIIQQKLENPSVEMRQFWIAFLKNLVKTKDIKNVQIDRQQFILTFNRVSDNSNVEIDMTNGEATIFDTEEGSEIQFYIGGNPTYEADRFRKFNDAMLDRNQ